MIEMPRNLKCFELISNKEETEKRDFYPLQILHKMSKSDISNIQGLIMLGFEDDDSYIIPEYQRNLVWTLKQKQDLILSILNGNPIGDFLFKKEYKKDDNGRKKFGSIKWYVIDGQQRVNTLREFILNKFSLNNGMTFKDLKYSDARYFLNDYEVITWSIEDISLNEEIDIYLKRNSGGTTHTEQEIEKAKKFLI